MSRVYIIFLCLIPAEVVQSVQQNRTASVIVDLYNKTLHFFEDFLSLRGVNNLARIDKNIPRETIRTLHNAWIPYTSLYRHILTWCNAVNETIDDALFQRFYLSLETQDQFASDVYRELNKMKEYFDSIATSTNKKKVENYQALVTFTDGVLKYEVIKGHTPDDIDDVVQPLFQKSKCGGNITLMMFDGKVNHAKIIITEALSVLNSTTNGIFNKEDIEDMYTKCSPFLNYWKTLMIPQKPPLEPSSLPPSPTINPSKKDMLMSFSPNSCGWFRQEDCVVVLSKQTLAQLLDFYLSSPSVDHFFNPDFFTTIDDFFDAIDYFSSSKECKDHIKSYITDEFYNWGLKAREMNDKQFMKISICFNSDTSNIISQLTIVN